MALRYPYALTGGVLLLIATAAAGSGFLVPFAALDFRSEDYAVQGAAEYDALKVTVRSHEGEEQGTFRYHEGSGDGAGVAALRLGSWLLAAGSLIGLAAAIALLAAPSSSLKAARAGAWLGLGAALAVVAAVAAFLSGWMEQGRDFVQALGGQNGMEVAGNRLLAGTFVMGGAAVLAAGGAFLGFSDKKTLVLSEQSPAS